MSREDKELVLGKPAHSVDHKNKIILDYLLSSVNSDARGYLEVDILGHKFLGLLDSGANSTIISGNCFSILERLGIHSNKSSQPICLLANGSKAEILGTVSLPIKLQDKVGVIDAYIMPTLQPSILLGIDFWRIMGILPNFKTMEWHFADSPKVELFSVSDQGELHSDQLKSLNEVVSKYLGSDNGKLGCTKLVQHVIRTTSAPIKQRSYRMNPIMQKYIDAELKNMLEAGIIEPSNSPWSSPVLLVPKKDGSFRFCVDFRKLNQVSLRDSYPLPYMSAILESLRDARFLSSIDIKSAYWQIELEENSKQYTAFSIPGRGLFHFKRMPYGLHNGPATWQRFVDKVLGPELEPYCFVYLDDVIIATPDFDTHLKTLREVLERLTNAGLTLNKEKCQLCLPELRYLGYIVNRQGLSVDPEKVNAILRIKAPATVKQVRSLLGLIGWYRRFIPNFAELVAPLSSLLKKNRRFEWTEECSKSFEAVRNLLVSAPILSCPNFDKPFMVQTDASAYGLGAVLSQKCEDGDRVISYLSRALTRQEQNYSTTERECLAVIWAVEKLRPYLEGQKFTVVTDHHSLVWLQNLKDPVGRLARWALRLQSYDYEIIHRKGKEHIVPDFLSRTIPEVNEAVVQQENNNSVVNDPWYTKMLSLVEKYPLRYPAFRICNGRLFKHIRDTHTNFDVKENIWKEVLPKDKRLQQMRQAHDNPTSGHCGVFKTFRRLSEFYFWPKMKSDVVNYVKRCQVCARYKPQQNKPGGEMSTRPFAKSPWHVVCMDIVGPLPRSHGYAYILVISCCFSKFPLIFPMREATGKIIARLVEENLFLLFGVPAAIITDNGSQFRGGEFRKLCEGYNVELWFTALYHPQANPAERTNRVLKTMLASYVKDNHKSWSVYLHKVACAMRTAVHEVTNCTPYFINFGREHIISGKLHEQISENKTHCVDDFIGHRSKAFQTLYQEIRERIRKAHLRSKQRYDLRQRPTNFQVNDLVYVKNHVLSDASRNISAKLSPKYQGPFKIKRKVSYLTYELDDNGKVKGIYHVQDLKPATCENLVE